MAGALIVISIVVSRRAKGMARASAPRWASSAVRPLGALPALMLPVIILGGILGGVVTVTEAAVLAVAYSFALSAFVYRRIGLRDVVEIAVIVTRIAVPVLLIIAVSNVFAWVITTERVPQMLIAAFQAATADPLVFLLLINVMLLLLGTFMESNALIIILIPILMPAVHQYGIDPIHFGVMFVVNLCIGANTPPLGGDADDGRQDRRRALPWGGARPSCPSWQR